MVLTFLFLTKWKRDTYSLESLPFSPNHWRPRQRCLGSMWCRSETFQAGWGGGRGGGGDAGDVRWGDWLVIHSWGFLFMCWEVNPTPDSPTPSIFFFLSFFLFQFDLSLSVQGHQKTLADKKMTLRLDSLPLRQSRSRLSAVWNWYHSPAWSQAEARSNNLLPLYQSGSCILTLNSLWLKRFVILPCYDLLWHYRTQFDSHFMRCLWHKNSH